MLNKNTGFGSATESIVYPLLLLVVMWLVFWADHLFNLVDFYKFGVMPKTSEGFKGIFFMPLIHSKNEIQHIVNNSLPTGILLAAIIFYYRAIALRFFVLSWLLTGLGVWLFAANNNSYHIGMSGVIYAMVGFLFTSGIIRKYRPLQGISMFVAFVYGSMIWGIFPMKTHVSWEGHLAGLVAGVTLAIIYRKQGPQSPKYMYEIESEMGIEPPDLEGQWRENVKRAEEQMRLMEEERKRNEEIEVIYHYQPKDSSKGKTDQ